MNHSIASLSKSITDGAAYCKAGDGCIILKNVEKNGFYFPDKGYSIIGKQQRRI